MFVFRGFPVQHLGRGGGPRPAGDGEGGDGAPGHHEGDVLRLDAGGDPGQLPGAD